jgi:YidC/Oxa1 family membrane protein insertase
MAPAGIDKAATVDGSHTSADAKSVEELLGLDPAAPVDTTPVLDIHAPITYWGQMKDLGLDYGWGSSAFFENLVELSYLNLEMGWVGSIALSALAIRSIIFFGFQVRGSDSMAKLGAMKPIMQPLNDEMEVAKRMGDDQRVQVLKMKQQSIMKEVGADIINNLGTPLAGMVFGFGAFRCLRGMTELPLPGMSTEKFLWINDLTVSDPLFLMPVLTSGMMYAVIKVC